MPVSGRSRVARDAVQQRHAEREGLAHAGAGLADQVVACQRQRQGQLLDSKGMFDAVLGQCADDFVPNSEFGKCWVEGGHMAFRVVPRPSPRAHEFRTNTSWPASR